MQASVMDTVIAVPPIARNSDLSVNREANDRLIKHIRSGGIRTLMYGGNANFQNIGLYEYTATLDMLQDLAAPDMNLIPAIGPDFGKMIDQILMLKGRLVAGVMVLPAKAAFTPSGIENGLRRLADTLGGPLIAYLRDDSYLSPASVELLIKSGAVCMVKYGVVRKNPYEDPYLAELVERLGANVVVSGIGERPALAHLEKYKLSTFTSGLASIAPRVSQAILKSFRTNDFEKARGLRELFIPLENLRDSHDPIQVLHETVSLSGIGNMGPMLPLMSNLAPEDCPPVQAAAFQLLRVNEELTSAHGS